MSTKVKIEFELVDKPWFFANCTSVKDSLHEALCRAIHEGDEFADQWLSDVVTNIDTVEEQP